MFDRIGHRRTMHFFRDRTRRPALRPCQSLAERLCRGAAVKSAFSALAVAAAAFLVGPGTAAAHPHVFIDADADLIFDSSGQLAAVRVIWTYDEFYSLMMMEDFRLDGDGDGTPDPDRLRAFAGKDVDWAAGFPGHIVLEQQGRALALEPPQAHAASYANGRITTSHVRPLSRPVGVTSTRSLLLRIYDPEYFVAYDTPRQPTVQGRSDCHIARRLPDTTGQDELLAALQALDIGSDSLTIMSMADVGITFADRFEVSCGGR
ncbi:DUF1007 family protein [Paracoccus benzoatiresistens]|uniref:DUF1007 family protein n=1 Tax=Paracoccus benzoatiresistens TaxID=2997341 RepID=A0ABT4J5U5_9RHOB|nr:DUF1007 family protein [Paracoccus sp. EF6]MCZ0962458.1 DUF1007 family protein [Paracoccus sp. EF6]